MLSRKTEMLLLRHYSNRNSERDRWTPSFQLEKVCFNGTFRCADEVRIVESFLLISEQFKNYKLVIIEGREYRYISLIKLMKPTFGF